MVFYFDMDGVIVNLPELKQSDYKKISSSLWVANLEPYPYNLQVVKWLIDNGHKVYILTRTANDNQSKGKILWLEKYLPMIPKENIIIMPQIQKIKYMKEPGVLIDDGEKQCKSWLRAGFPVYYIKNKGENINVKTLLALGQGT